MDAWRHAFVQKFRTVVAAIILALLALQVPAAAALSRSSSNRAILPGECRALDRLAGEQADASPALAACLSSLAPGATLGLAPGQYHLRTPLTIARPVTIETRPPLSPSACRRGDASRCAVFVIEEMPPQLARGAMPVEVIAANVTLSAIAIVGNKGRDAEWERNVCLNDQVRPLGGGLRVRAPGFRLEKARVGNFSCYTGLELTAGATGIAILDNMIGPNGTHDVRQMWADGVTVHDSRGARIEGNVFRDNTDVQLILGGCRDCIIHRNIFRHSSGFAHAAFAELMLHAWPSSSGDFSGSVTSENDIDCGAARRCGYGLMIGGEPWYPARTSGGTVSDNRVTGALVALNVDRLTGAMTVVRNRVARSGGLAKSDCGVKLWPAINISPRSVGMIRTDMEKFSSIDTSKCIILRSD